MPLSKLFSRRGSKDKQNLPKGDSVTVVKGEHSTLTSHNEKSPVDGIHEKEVPVEEGCLLENNLIAEEGDHDADSKVLLDVENISPDSSVIKNVSETEVVLCDSVDGKELEMKIPTGDYAIVVKNEQNILSSQSEGTPVDGIQEKKVAIKGGCLLEKDLTAEDGDHTANSGDLLGVEEHSSNSSVVNNVLETEIAPCDCVDGIELEVVQHSDELMRNENKNVSTNEIYPKDDRAKARENSNAYVRSNSQKDVPVDPPKARRKKCQSESGVPKGHEKDLMDGIIRERGKSLDDAISRYVDKMVRNSIMAAIRNVNVESLYEEIVKDFNDRKASSFSDEMNIDSMEIMSSEDGLNGIHPSKVNRTMRVCHDYSSDDEYSEDISYERTSIKEDELESPEKIKDNFERKDFLPDCQIQCEMPTNKEYIAGLKDTLLDGYQADCEESASIHSILSISSDDKLDERTNEEVLHTFEAQTVRGIAKNEDIQIVETSEVNASNDLKSHELSDISAGNTENGPLSNSSKLESEDFMTIVPGSDDISLKGLDLTPGKVSGHSEEPRGVIPTVQVQEEEKKMNWKVGYLHVKTPHKTRGKTHLKAWKKRCVSIQPDEFVNDPRNPCLMMSVYSAESGTSRKHNAVFWKTVSCQKAVVYRSSSRSHKYAFTVCDGDEAVVHLAADSETASQEWMAAVRAILWPPSPVVQLEKMLNGSEFEISLIDNDFSYHAGLLGMYGYLSITPKKLILMHPQQGYVIQEWYLNTVDKFQLVAQSKVEDVNKVLSMTTCSDSSTGRGEILLYCTEAVSLLQALAQTIHQVLSFHSKQEGGRYKKELDEIADWLIGPTSTDKEGPTEDYYKVPPRQVKSLLDIPNFIFEKSLSPVASMADTTSASAEATKRNLETLKDTPLLASHDSGISAVDDFLNCSVASFKLGGGALTGKSSDSELSDSYSPPRSPAVQRKHQKDSNAKEPAET